MLVKDILLTQCHAKCGALVIYKSNKRKYCPSCALAKKRETARRVMTAQRIKKGIKPVKGQTIACADCKIELITKSVNTKRCKPCQDKVYEERARVNSRIKRSTDDGRKYFNSWSRNKTQTDVASRISAHFKVLIHRALGKNKAGKSWKTFVDYSLEELMQHLEKQFLAGMNWENKGDWHIDHIVPRTSFVYSSPDDAEFKAAWALSNLRPIWAIDNIRKNAKITHLI